MSRVRAGVLLAICELASAEKIARNMGRFASPLVQSLCNALRLFHEPRLAHLASIAAGGRQEGRKCMETDEFGREFTPVHGDKEQELYRARSSFCVHLRPVIFVLNTALQLGRVSQGIRLVGDNPFLFRTRPFLFRTRRTDPVKHFLLLAALIGGLAARPTPAIAADDSMKPVAIVAGEGYDALMSDIGFVGKLTDNPDQAQQVDGLLKLFTQGQGVKGLDTKRPWGLVVNTDGVQFQPVAFLPVVSLKQLLASLGPVIGDAKANGDVLEVRKNNRSLFLKEAGGWAFVAQSPDGLQNLPKDPAGLIGKLADKYDLAVQIKVQNIPEMYRELAIGQLKAGVQSGVERDDDESQEAFDARKKMIATQINALSDAINETDQLTLGWKLDGETASTFLEVQITAIKGSKVAQAIALKSQATSAFTGFLLPDAALAATLSAKLSPEEQASRTSELDVLKLNLQKKIEDTDKIDDDDKDLAKQVAGDLIDVLKKTVASGKTDAGLAVTLGDTLNLVGGFYVSDPAAIEKLFKRLKDAAKNESDKTKFSDEKFDGTTLHTVTMPIDNKKLADILGDDLAVTLGIGKQTVYLAIGDKSLDALKGILSTTAAKEHKLSPPFQATADLTSILEFVDENTDVPEDFGKLVKAAKKWEGKDHIRLRAIPNQDTMTYRLELEEGVLRVLAKLGKSQAGGGR
jgi:hypothetical protein